MKTKNKTVLVIDYKTNETIGILEWYDKHDDYVFTPEIGVTIDERKNKIIQTLKWRLK